ncbi:oligo/dipeptide ABC transporter ATP-binding protein [Neobacillus bataviensis LMG 21833]|uniref:Oligo/dipeptide ABC transporter ATP-binding protein n=1 Tax=Neobacillus bataviensis LMG 21833 TaxID=1117379 RepID=K6DDY7_9BACI|nr:oligopeptide/dipeptide ABC transporter ATP-binding protein [Neobacillus bataviensis]EKN66489.1 oligo/dipeptide ABC transporter ATP-binding protein [Neobacillus bataviensis LMG 21833]
MIELVPKKQIEKEVLFSIRHLKTYYPVLGGFFRKQIGTVKAVDDISITVRKGETIGIVGESGCGKSTLGKTMMLLEKPTDGEMIYNFDGHEKDITKLDSKEIFDFRSRVQMIFQDPYSSFNPSKRIFDAFDEPLRVHGYKDPAVRKQMIEKALHMVNLSEEYLHRFPHEFSGGQRQRISIARALCINPELIICDEPVSALDVSIQAQVLNLMKEIQQELNLTYVFIAHDLSVVQYMSDRVVVMYLGKIVEISNAEDLHVQPLHPYTEALLSAVPVPVVSDMPKERIILEGDVPSPINRPTGCPFSNRCPKRMDICSQVEPVLQPYNDKQHFVACHLYNE